MQKNVGKVDRVLRGVVGIWLLLVAVSALRSERTTTSMIAGVAGLGLIQNATTGFCGGNWLFGLDTTRAGNNQQCSPPK